MTTNPLADLLPTADQLAAMNDGPDGARVLHDVLLEIATTFEGLLEQAHRDDHGDPELDLGGSHPRTRAIAVAEENVLVERYADSPVVLARLLITFITDIALEATAEELHAGGADG